MSAFRHDVRYALRSLRSSPGFAAVAIVTIALAVGSNTALFSFVNGMVLNPLPYADADRIVRVLERRPDGGLNSVSTLNYLDWKAQSTSFEVMSPRTGWQATWTGGDEPVQLQGGRGTVDFFKIYGMSAAHGRLFAPGEDELGNDKVVVLTHAFWENRFGADPSAVGRSIVLNGEPHEIIGVLEAGTFDRDAAQIWKPLAFEPSNMTRDFHWFGVFGKLKPDVTLEQARAEMEVIGSRISAEHPASNQGWNVGVDRAADIIGGPQLRQAVWVMFAATAFVVLIGCANLASLALVRGVSREREIAVRAALGASRWRLARQFLTENVLIAVCGGIAGIGVGFATMKWIESLIPPFTFPAELGPRMDGGVMLFAFAVAVTTGVLFGLAPAVQATRPNLTSAMKEGGHGSTSGHGGRVRAALVVGEIALAFVLLVGAGLMMRSVFSLLAVEKGFDSSNVLTAGLPAATRQYPDPVTLNAYLDSVRAAVEAAPGVTGVAMTTALPLQGWGYGMPFQIVGRDAVDAANRRAGFFKIVTPSYFATLGINLRSGRTLSDSDTSGAPPVAMINETFAKREFPDGNAIGQRVLVQQIIPGQTGLGAEIPWEIVGVIADEKIGGLDDVGSGGLYVSYRQSPAYGMNLAVRGATDPARLQGTVRAAIDSVNKDQALSRVRTLEQIEAESMSAQRIQSILYSVFATIALLLAAVGIYGVISYSVVQRTHEMGIRAALGASRATLRQLVFRSGMLLASLGLVLGLVGALALTRVMTSILSGVSPRDPLTLAAVAVVLAIVAAVACFIPAQRATRVAPNTALRYQ
ncbi:MAG TPA: ABC transporter permease [Gammaproteobacteria bacterium]|nr:ABC transporter permease [Gammaproteobacteria bacterium]